MTSVGVIEWYNSTGYPYPTATPFRLDGRYYAESENGWWTSPDGLAWSEMASAPDVIPAEFSSKGSNFETFDVDGETWATLAPSIGAIRLFHRQGEHWAEVPVTTPQPPPGIELVKANRGAILVNGIPRRIAGETFRGVGAPASTVVMQSDQVMTVPDPNGNGSGMVALNNTVYGVSVQLKDGHADGFTVWRSEDGVEWAPVVLPEMSPNRLSWAYLTAGHGRLMLSVGAPQEFWSSPDGVAWQPVEIAGVGGMSGPTPPLPTDFGWMIVNHGETLSDGQFNLKQFRLLVSPDGLKWQSVAVPRLSGAYICCGRNELTYQDDLFVRYSVVDGFKVRIGKFAD